MKAKEKLPRGIRRRGNSLLVSFALDDGTIERRSLGMASVSYAVEQLGIFKRQVREGCYEKRQPRVEETLYTVGNLWDAYLLDYKNRGGKDASRLGIAWARLKGTFGSRRVEEVTTNLVNQYIETRRADGMENGTINRETATLRAMFHHGTRVTPPMVERTPAFPARLKEPPPRKGFVTDEQYRVLAAHAKPLWLRCLIATAFAFGFRKGELLNLRARQVDLLDKWLTLEEGTTKNDEGRKVKMTSEVFGLMLECVRGKKPDDYLFTREPGGQHVVDPREEWYSLCVASGLGAYLPAKRKNGKDYLRYVGVNLHDFRRAAIRVMTRRGVSETVAMKISGHKTASVFRRYKITDDHDLAEATRLIEAGRPVKSDTKSDTSTYAHS